ncbi:hypothetical protein Ahy_A02g006765 isoform A [Arachis hypogaea]|uniref:Transposase MuDR plant domain-containing protein n=1 Tax=Arachis hypogaea TaxID=3818 RepID=A0A445EAP0_ARAHY|nr:hypothetical protein Ahy_A02g006765 isoform A [Arachis hypogaea]
MRATICLEYLTNKIEIAEGVTMGLSSLQEMFSIYYKTQSQVCVLRLYVEFEHLPNTVEEPGLGFDWRSYKSESEGEYDGNYNFIDPNADKEQADCTIESDMEDVANALASEHPFREPSFIRVLDLDVMNEPKFLEYANADPPVVGDGEFVIKMQFISKETMIKAVKCVQYGPAVIGLSGFQPLRKFRALFMKKLLVNIDLGKFDHKWKHYGELVREMPNGVEYAIDLRRRHCDCGEFQVDHFQVVMSLPIVKTNVLNGKYM